MLDWLGRPGSEEIGRALNQAEPGRHSPEGSSSFLKRGQGRARQARPNSRHGQLVAWIWTAWVEWSTSFQGLHQEERDRD